MRGPCGVANIFGVTGVPGASDGAPSGVFAHVLKLDIDKDDIDAALAGFPLALFLRSSSGIGTDDVTAVFDELTSDANRKKIKITTDAGGNTQCYVEIQEWDDASEFAVLWVKVPSVASGSDTRLYFWYDVTQPDNLDYVGDTGDTPGKAVWDSDFDIVYHLTQAAGATVLDSTANGNNGTPVHAPASVTGKIGKCLDFDATNDYVDLNELIDPTPDTDEFTLEAWVKRDSGSWQSVFNKRYSAGGNGQIACYTGGSTDGEMKVMIGNAYMESTGTPFADTNWHHVAIRNYDDTGTLKHKIYIDGAPDATAALASGSVTVDADFLLAARRDTNNTDFASVLNGKMDEFRYSSVGRSAAWIKACYEGQRDHLITWDLA